MKPAAAAAATQRPATRRGAATLGAAMAAAVAAFAVAAFAALALTAGPATAAAPDPAVAAETTAIRVIGASLSLADTAVTVDTTTIAAHLAYATATTAVNVAAGTHRVSVGPLETTVAVGAGCTDNIVAAQRGPQDTATLVVAPECDNNTRIPVGHARLHLIVASDQPGTVIATIADTAVTAVPYQTSPPLQPPAGDNTFTIANAATATIYTTVNVALAEGSATLAVYTGQDDQPFQTFAAADGSQPKDPPDNIEINSGLPNPEPGHKILAAILALLTAALAATIAAAHRRRVAALAAVLAVTVALTTTGCAKLTNRGAANLPAANLPAATPPGKTASTPTAPATPTGPAGGDTPTVIASADTVAVAAAARITIAAINVDAPIVELPTSDAPDLSDYLAADTVAHLDGTANPGATGVAVIVGHTGIGGTTGAFRRLPQLQPGDLITIVDTTGVARNFKVDTAATYTKNQLPPQLWAPQNGLRPTVVVITCVGPTRPDGRHRDNYVVTATQTGL